MPELPEVETISRILAKKTVRRTIRRIRLNIPPKARGRLIRDLRAHEKALENSLKGRRILGIRRRAKYLILDAGSDLVIFHLGMTGQLFAARQGEKPCCGLIELPDKHTHLILVLDDHSRLFFRDIRKFGRLMLISASAEKMFFRLMGPEPLGAEFSLEHLRVGLKGKKAPIKSLLLAQKLVSGLGNIYVDEALFRARIKPQAPGACIKGRRVKKLHVAIREVLREAIRFRGTSMSDYYDPESRRGGFQARLRVYGREGEACVRCGQPVIKAQLAGRGTHWCASCQQ